MSEALKFKKSCFEKLKSGVKIVKCFRKSLKVTQMGIKWTQISRWSQMSQTVSNGVKWSQMVSKGLIGFKWSQMVSNVSNGLK